MRGNTMVNKMNIETAGLIYYSPTRTTRKVIEGIARGLQVAIRQIYDMASPDAVSQPQVEFAQNMAIIGAPVYAGRLPSVMLSRVQRINGGGRPAVIVVVYGNRAYEDALVELRDVALATGFKPIAAGAFIGEHSYSTSLLPIAQGRPDGDDMSAAYEFGKAIRDKIMTGTGDANGLLHVPGNFPYKDVQVQSGIAPSAHEALCSKCGKCVSVCPTAAINRENPLETSKDLCTRCCACVKACPNKAKWFDDPRIRRISEWLHANCGERKEPETFLS